MRRVACFVMLTCLQAGRAQAQELTFLNGIFARVHSVTIYGQGLQLLSESDVRGRNQRCGGLDICGAGSEILIDVASAPQGIHLEVGLGASYLGGLASRTPDLDLRGSVRSFPTFTAYLTGINTPFSNIVEPYVGVSFGISDLWNARAYGPGNASTPVKAQTFDFGGTLGGYVNTGLLDGLFLEVSYKVRRFDGLDWGRTDLPAAWPRELDFSGWAFAVGWQFNLKEQSHRAPELKGLWELGRVDGQPLPFVVKSAAEPTGFERTEILHGLLSVSEGRYSLIVARRVSHVDNAGKLISADVPRYATYSGLVRDEGGSMSLVPPRSREAKPVMRVGDDIALELPDPDTPVLLQFKKVQ